MASMRLPAKPSSAGSRVVAASTITATPIAAASPSVRTSGIGTTSSPSSAMHTVIPAKIAARPEVCTAYPTASVGSWPSATNCRYRVTISSE